MEPGNCGNRHIVMKGVLLPVVLLSLLAASACTTDSSEKSAAPDSPAPPSASAEPVSEVMKGLRGEPIPRDTCPLARRLPSGAVGNPQPKEAIPAPQAFLICPPYGGMPLLGKDAPSFPSLVDALSKPDPKWEPSGCLDFADSPQSVVALTHNGQFFHVYIPEDGCGHYQKPAQRAVATSWPDG